MKKNKIIQLVILIITILVMHPVYAANYEMKELIPKDIETTIVTNSFSYRKIVLNDGKIKFNSIKNISDKELPISISIGLFNDKKRNIGTINYCENKLNVGEERKIEIDTTPYLGKDYKTYDIKYIAVLNENINCRTTGEDDYLGQNLKEISRGKNNTLDENTEMLLGILKVVGGVLIIIFLYKFLFTREYQNVDGNDVRQGYKSYNRDLQREREEELRKNPPKPKEKKKIKSDEVLIQEEIASKEDKEGSDLHNMYK